MEAVNVLLALIAYTAIITAVVIFVRGSYNDKCDQDCNQGRDCHCDDEWNFK